MNYLCYFLTAFLSLASLAHAGSAALPIFDNQIPLGVHLECLSDYHSDLAAGKSPSLAASNRTACQSNWRIWYKGRVSYMKDDCPGCADEFMSKLLELTSACRDGDGEFIDSVKSREGMDVSKKAAHDICTEVRARTPAAAPGQSKPKSKSLLRDASTSERILEVRRRGFC